jgi:hypothetical protein
MEIGTNMILEINTDMTAGFMYTIKETNTWSVLLSFEQVIPNFVVGRSKSERASLTGWIADDIEFILKLEIRIFFLQSNFIQLNGKFFT